MNSALKSLADLCGRILAEMWIAEQMQKAKQKASGQGVETAVESKGEGEVIENDKKLQ